ncbi:MAG: MFS transporter [Actinomycetia bacterium]|nr:MFS transporter [Actinomycetes bacterium]
MNEPEPDSAQAQEPGMVAGAFARLFATPEFFRLWLAQVFSAFGDWVGFLAIIVIAERVGGDTAGSAIALVMIARILPGFFLASVGGVIVDRFNRKRLLITCDIVRAAVFLFLPVIDTVWGLVLASLVLELATSLWGPAKEAIVPNVVPAHHLTTANSLSLMAAYGTFPFASAAFAGLDRLSDWLVTSGRLRLLDLNREALALYVDAGTFLVAAWLIATLPLVARTITERRDSRRRIDWSSGVRELKEGWRFIALNPTVRAVMIALGTGMIGGGMLIPLGSVFNHQVLRADDDGFGAILTALGVGVGVGVAILSAIQTKVDKRRSFVFVVMAAGITLLLAVSVSTIQLTLLGVFGLGLNAGAVYVLGFTLLHESVADDLRGRVFSALYTLVRFCLLVAIGIGGFLSEALDWVFERLFDSRVEIGPIGIDVVGVRGALWLAGLLIIGAGILAAWSLRGHEPLADDVDPEVT